MSQRKNVVKAKVVVKKWFIRIGHFEACKLGTGGVRACLRTYWLQFYNQRKSRKWGENLLCLSWVYIMLPSSVLPPGWSGQLSCPTWASWFHKYWFYVCKRVCGRFQLAELTGQYVGLMHHCFLFQGMSHASAASFVTKRACLVLWLSKPAFLSNPH